MRRVLLIGQGPTAESALASLLPRFDVVGLVRSAGRRGRGAVPPSRRRRCSRSVTGRGRGGRPRARSRRRGRVLLRPHPPATAARRAARSSTSTTRRCPSTAAAPPSTGRSSTGAPATAITVHVLVAELDAGPILFQRAVAIGPDDTVDRCLRPAQRAAATASRARRSSAISTATPDSPQDDGGARPTRARACPRDGEIDWNRPTADVHALVRALADPFPGAFTLPRRPPAGDLASGAPRVAAPLGGPGARPRGRPLGRRGLG